MAAWPGRWPLRVSPLPVTQSRPDRATADRASGAIQVTLRQLQERVNAMGAPSIIVGPFTFTAGQMITIDHKLLRQPTEWLAVDIFGGYGSFQRISWSTTSIKIQSQNACMVNSGSHRWQPDLPTPRRCICSSMWGRPASAPAAIDGAFGDCPRRMFVPTHRRRGQAPGTDELAHVFNGGASSPMTPGQGRVIAFRDELLVTDAFKIASPRVLEACPSSSKRQGAGGYEQISRGRHDAILRIAARCRVHVHRARDARMGRERIRFAVQPNVNGTPRMIIFWRADAVTGAEHVSAQGPLEASITGGRASWLSAIRNDGVHAERHGDDHLPTLDPAASLWSAAATLVNRCQHLELGFAICTDGTSVFFGLWARRQQYHRAQIQPSYRRRSCLEG